MEKTWEAFAQWALKLNNRLSQSQLEKFQTYHQLLLEWNKRINLVSRKDIERLVSYHFADSISAVTEIPQNSLVGDLGTGAGLPGIPLKIARDDITLYLIESIKKKAVFLSDAINTLKLNNAFPVNQRAETIKDKKFDIVLVRLFGKIPDVLPLAGKLLNKNGKVIFYKISGVEAEIERARLAELKRAKKVAMQSRFELTSIKDVKLPFTDILRKLVIYERQQ